MIRSPGLVVSALFAALSAVAAGQDGAVPVEEEPRHKTVFKNRYVQVFHVTLAPGERSLTHIHARDDAAVRFSHATVTSQLPGEAPGPPETARPGLVTARTIEPGQFTHRVQNVGATPFEVMDVQVLARPEGPPVSPIGAPVAENPRLRVYRYELAPRGAASEHTHQRPYLLVAVTDVKLRLRAAQGAFRTRQMAVGTFEWTEAPGAHALVNAGAAPAIVVEFELK